MSLATVLPIAKDLATRPDGFNFAELTSAATVSHGSVGYYIKSLLTAGHIFKGQPEGKKPRYFDTPERAHAYACGEIPPGIATDAREAVARAAVAHLRKQTLGSAALAGLCHVSAAEIDAALAPLADAGKLTRLNVLRSGRPEFDYRWGATWVPSDADFDSCRRTDSAPVASVSPVAAAAPGGSAGVASRPDTSRPYSETPVESGRRGGASRRAGIGLDRALAQPPHSLGWEAAPTRKVQPAAATSAAPDDDITRVELEATDLVCALNSRGELALELADGGPLVKFKPKAALILTRFLAGNTVLEQMHARGEL